MAFREFYVNVLLLFSFNIDFYTGNPVESVKFVSETFNFESFKTKYTEEIAFLKKEIVMLKERVTKLETQSDSTDGRSVDSYPDATVGSTEHHLNKRAAVMRRRRRAPEIAFQASLTKEYATFKLYDAIVFNEVLTNIGRAYNKHTGIFTAPLAGTYSFYTNIVSEKGHYIEASIQVNDKATVSAISDHRIATNKNYFGIWDQGNAVAILSLHKGDKVCVSVQWPQGSHDIHGVGKSSFSGYLLRSHERI